jgi:hypothetical protein
MPIWLRLLTTCWAGGFLILGFWTWLRGAEMSMNLLPGVSRWKLALLGRTPAPHQLNEKGRAIRRSFYRLLWILIAYFVGGGLLLDAVKSALK